MTYTVRNGKDIYYVENWIKELKINVNTAELLKYFDNKEVSLSAVSYAYCTLFTFWQYLNFGYFRFEWSLNIVFRTTVSTIKLSFLMAYHTTFIGLLVCCVHINFLYIYGYRYYLFLTRLILLVTMNSLLFLGHNFVYSSFWFKKLSI